MDEEEEMYADGGNWTESAWITLTARMINVAVDDHLLPRAMRYEEGEIPDDADVLIPKRMMSSGVLAMLRGFEHSFNT